MTEKEFWERYFRYEMARKVMGVNRIDGIGLG